MTYSPLSIGNNTHIRGALGNDAGPGGTIINAVSDLFRVQAHANHVTFENVSLYGNGGASTRRPCLEYDWIGLWLLEIHGRLAFQFAYNYGIIYATGDDGGGTDPFYRRLD